MSATFTGPNGDDPVRHFGKIMTKIQPTEAELLLAGQYLRGQIRKRTFADQQLGGGNFVPYSPSYAKQKGQTNVDLYGKGAGKHMLDALTVKAGMAEAANGQNAVGDDSVPADAINLGIYGDEKMATRAKVHDQGGSVKTRQGTGRWTASRKSHAFGADIRKQKKGGKRLFSIPWRPWLGATWEDLNAMRKLITEAIANRLNGI